MCASPIALEKAGLLENRRYTAYQGYDEKIKAGQYEKEAVVTDGHLVTAGGPACAYAFAYTLAELLGADSEPVKERMVYYNTFDAGKGD